MGPMVAYCIPPSSIKQINTLQVPASLNALVEKLEIFKKQNARFSLNTDMTDTNS